MFRIFPKNRKNIFIYYFISPIVFYAAFMHSQLDLIPTAFLFTSVYFLINGKLLSSALLYGIAIGSKHHTLIALPLLLIYILRNYGLINTAYFILISFSLFFFTLFPYLNNEGFYQLIFNNPAQMLVYDSFYKIGKLKLYLPIFVSGILYLRFFMYQKINHDLLFAFINLLFATFILLVNPTPGWYLWISPFVAIFFIKYHDQLEFALFSPGHRSIYIAPSSF